MYDTSECFDATTGLQFAIFTHLIHLSAFHHIMRVTVEPLAFLCVLTIYAEYTALQEMIATKLCNDLSNATSIHVCDRTALTSDQRQQLSAEMSGEMMRYMGIFSLCAVPASLFTGSWSDTLGRKPLLLLPSAFGLIAEVLFALCSFFLACDNILILVYIGAFFNGVSGGSTTAVSSFFGYIADITDSEAQDESDHCSGSSTFCGRFRRLQCGRTAVEARPSAATSNTFSVSASCCTSS